VPYYRFFALLLICGRLSCRSRQTDSSGKSATSSEVCSVDQSKSNYKEKHRQRLSFQRQLGLRNTRKNLPPEKYFQYAMENKGDLEKGMEIFASNSIAQCNKCHADTKKAPNLGETADRLRRYLSNGLEKMNLRAYIIESILYPSKFISSDYKSVAIITKNGKSLSGLMVDQNDNEITLGLADDSLVLIKIIDIDQKVAIKTSNMPEGQYKSLTLQEFASLVDYLEKFVSPQQYADFAMSQKGDQDKGKTVFESQVKGACLSCHAIYCGDSDIGPLLGGVSRKYLEYKSEGLKGIPTKYDNDQQNQRLYIIEAMLYPSKFVVKEYRSSQLITTDSQVYRGIADTKNEPNVVLQIDAETKKTFHKNKVRNLQEIDSSIMPAGLQQGMTMQEFTDLIDYLMFH